MLKSIDPVLTPDVLYALRAMGHGDEIACATPTFRPMQWRATP